MVKIATAPKPPKRLFEKDRRAAKARMDAVIGPIPPEVERLREALEVIDPAITYRHEMPDGQVVTSTGAELLETARLMLAIAEAHESGDEAALRRAAMAWLSRG